MSLPVALSEPAEFDLHLTAGNKCTHLILLATFGIFSAAFLALAFQSQLKPKAAWILFFVIFTIVFVCLIFQHGLKDGRIGLDVDTLTIEQHGRLVRIPYNEIAKIALTKVISGRSLMPAVLIEMTNFARIYILEIYYESSEDIFDLLKRRLEPLAPSVRFTLKREITVA